jgi:hypothetical protein
MFGEPVTVHDVFQSWKSRYALHTRNLAHAGRQRPSPCLEEFPIKTERALPYHVVVETFGG